MRQEANQMKSLMKNLLAVALLAAPTALLAVPPAVGGAAAAAVEPIRAVYHVNEAEKTWTALRNIQNHLRDDATTKIVVVANGNGIDFLLKDAVDKQGTPFQPTLEEFKKKGVVFKVCRNTLTSRKLTDEAVASEALVVQAAVAEIARLQIREGYAYLKP
jgi:intracellular sulfur oxidation DsrE/DsrF family protein